METRLIDKQAAQAKFEVTVPAAEVDQAYERILAALARQVRIPGFRPGRAPRGVLIRQIGEHALSHEVREALLDDAYPKAVQELELTPVHAHVDAGHPSEGSDFTFAVEVDLYPEIALPDLSGIVIDTQPREIQEDEVERTVENLRRENATLVPVERPVEATDQVLVEMLGEEDEGSGSSMPIDLESVDPEFGGQLLGKTIGEVVELRLSAPAPQEAEASEDEGAEEAEKAAPEAPTLRVKIVDVKEKEKPEADDEFAKTLGFESWSEVDARIRETLAAQVRAEADEERREEFVEKLLAETSFELPASLVDRRKRNLLESLASDLEGRGMTMEGYLASLEEKGTREEFERELQESAEKGVRRDLVLERLMEVRGTTLTDEEFADALRHVAAREGKDPAGLRREMGDDWMQNYRFLLTRDKALREQVRELVGEDEPGADAEGDDASSADGEPAEDEPGDAPAEES